MFRARSRLFKSYRYNNSEIARLSELKFDPWSDTHRMIDTFSCLGCEASVFVLVLGLFQCRHIIGVVEAIAIKFCVPLEIGAAICGFRELMRVSLLTCLCGYLASIF